MRHLNITTRITSHVLRLTKNPCKGGCHSLSLILRIKVLPMDPTKINIPWTESPFFPQLLERSNYDEKTKELLRNFSRDGYVVIDLDIDHGIIDKAIDKLEGNYRTEGRINETRRVLNGWKENEYVKQIATLPQVMDLLQVLYQRRPIPFQTLNFNMGSEQKTHSDSIHFHCIPNGFMCGVWVAFEEVNEFNGPLHYYPGSQKLPYYDMSHVGIRASYYKNEYEHYGAYEDFVEELLKSTSLERKEVHMKKGQALIWAANLFHGGSPIKDKNSTRYSQVTHYYFDNCFYYRPLHSDIPLGRWLQRNVVNIATGQKEKHIYLGQEVKQPFLKKVLKKVL